MYQTQSKFNIDNMFGGLLLVAGVAWGAAAIMFAPLPDVPVNQIAAQSDQPRMVLAEPAGASSSAVTTFPVTAVVLIADKKFA